MFFHRTAAGNEPVRDWLKEVGRDDRHAIGIDLLRVQEMWPIGMPTCRSLGKGLWGIRTDLTGHRAARVLFFVDDDGIGVVHGFIKKMQQTAAADLELAHKRMKELKG